MDARIVLLLLASLAAGWVDAVVGGVGTDPGARNGAPDVLKPLIMVVLLAVAALVVLKPGMGRVPSLVLRTRRRTAAAILVQGHVLWTIGLAMAVCNIIGA